jgi:hypothetical protein
MSGVYRGARAGGEALHALPTVDRQAGERLEATVSARRRKLAAEPSKKPLQRVAGPRRELGIVSRARDKAAKWRHREGDECSGKQRKPMSAHRLTRITPYLSVTAACWSSASARPTRGNKMENAAPGIIRRSRVRFVRAV